MTGPFEQFDRVPKRWIYTVGLAAGGLGYAVFLALQDRLPSLAEFGPSLAAGVLLGFAFDRFLGYGGLVALVDGDLLAERLASARTRFFSGTAADAGRRSADGAFATGSAGRVEGGESGVREDEEEEEKRDEDEESDEPWTQWLTILSLGSTVGFAWLIRVSIPWVVGLLLGAVGLLVAIRLVRLVSPFCEGMAPPPRGVPADSVGTRE